jgi:NAD(P)-dependent dehydrogenase (short-subunit alcohol dehydrogenase family)
MTALSGKGSAMDGKVVIVTGANQGIGFHLTRALLERGYRVAGFDLSLEQLTGLREEHPQAVSTHRRDVTDPAQVEAAVTSVVQTWGGIDVLVNNACLAVFGPFEERSLEGTRREFEVNYFGYLHTIRAVLPHMKARGGGIIHNVGSGVGLTGFPGLYGYASTKGAVEALTRTLALEFAPYHIQVSVLHPPLTNTRSAAPLGVPPEMMDDPKKVGRGLAARIERAGGVITPDLRTGLGIACQRHLPGVMGRLLARMTARAREDGSS